MQNHVKVYLDYFGYCQSDVILCECCGVKAVDIHHIEPRSKFGKKTKHLQDDINNLIALCRQCHNLAHEINNKEILTEIHKHKLNSK